MTTGSHHANHTELGTHGTWRAAWAALLLAVVALVAAGAPALAAPSPEAVAPGATVAQAPVDSGGTADAPAGTADTSSGTDASTDAAEDGSTDDGRPAAAKPAAAPAADGAPAGPGVHVSALDVQDTKDGTGPFDADDSAGNDSGERNGVCRSFDTVSYTLGYVTALDDASVTVSSARLRLTVTLACSPKEARIDESGMAWAEDSQVTYAYDDGTTSVGTWDKTKTVTSQTWVGYRTLAGKSSDDRVPGAGQLSVGMRLWDATNGKSYQPHAILEVVGSDRSRELDLTAVRASSALRLDVEYNAGWEFSRRNVVYFDPDGQGGSASSLFDTDPTARPLSGRYYATALGLMIHDQSSAKGMRGCSIPEGPVTFDVSSKLTVDGADSTTGTDFRYLLWDARGMEETGSTQAESLYHRTMNHYISAWAYPNGMPYNSSSADRLYCACRIYEERPRWTFSEDASTPGLLHVTVTPPASGWIDWDTLSFPHTTSFVPSDPGGQTYPDRQYLATGVVQHMVVFPRDVDRTRSLVLTSQVGQDTLRCGVGDAAQAVPCANPGWRKSVGTTVSLFTAGSFSTHNYYYGLTRSFGYSSCGDGAAVRGQTINVSILAGYTGNYHTIARDCLAKIDTDNLEVVDQGTDGEPHDQSIGSWGERGQVRMLYAAKPDGTGWASEDEQRGAHITDLVYYKTYADIKASGKVCVGMLREDRGCDLLTYDDNRICVFNVKVTGEPGNVAPLTHESAVWMDYQQAPGSATDHQNADGSYGIVHEGNKPGQASYFDGFPDQPYTGCHFASYNRTVYSNGRITGGNNGAPLYGNSVLILGAKTSVSVRVSSEDGSESGKRVFDLDAGERTVMVTSQPALTAWAGGTTGDTGFTDDVTLTVTLPKGLSYQTGTASRTPTSITQNPDGTTTLAFSYENAPVGEHLAPVTLKAYIGNPGAEDDAKNNQQFTVTTHVDSATDPGKATEHDSSASFRVVRLAALSVSKNVSRTLDNTNSPFDWTLRVANTSETDAENAAIADVLPYQGDMRGTTILGGPRGEGAASPARLEGVSVDLSHAPRTRRAMEALSCVVTCATATGDAPVPTSWATSAMDVRPSDGSLDGLGTSAGTCRYDHLGALSGASWSGDVATFDLAGRSPDALYVALGDLCAHEYVTVTLHMGYPDASERTGTTLTNQFVEDSDDQPAAVVSNAVTHRAESTVFSVSKAWAGDGPAHPSRPGSVTATVTGTDGSSRQVTLSADRGWRETLDLPAFDAAGERVTYSVTEDWESPAYDPGVVTGSQTSGFTITNNASRHAVPMTGGTGAVAATAAAGLALVVLAAALHARAARRR